MKNENRIYIAESYERIGSLLDAIALNACDIGKAVVNGNEYPITWGRNISNPEWWLSRTTYDLMKCGDFYEIILNNKYETTTI